MKKNLLIYLLCAFALITSIQEFTDHEICGYKYEEEYALENYFFSREVQPQALYDVIAPVYVSKEKFVIPNWEINDTSKVVKKFTVQHPRSITAAALQSFEHLFGKSS